MRLAGLSRKTATEMGHLPQTASDARAGMVDAMQASSARRKVLIHINNSNPILDEDSAQRRAAGRARHRGGVRRHGDHAVNTTAWQDAWRRAAGSQRSRACAVAARGLRGQAARLRVALPHPPPLQPAPQPRRAAALPGARLGGEPLLLPGLHPAEGCGGAGQLHRPRRAAALGRAHPRPRRARRLRRRQRRRHRGLEPARPGGGPRTRRRSGRSAMCSPACASPSTPTSTSRAARRGRKRRSPR